MKITIDMRAVIWGLCLAGVFVAGGMVRALSIGGAESSISGIRVPISDSGVVVQAARYGQEGVRVSGTATVRARPDIANMVIGYESCRASVAESKDDADQVMRKVITAFKGQGIQAKDIQTVRYDIDRWCCCHTHSDNHWHVINMVQVRIHDVGRVADIVEAAVKAGSNKTDYIQYSVENLRALRAKAREKAVEMAREKAQQLAKLMNVSLGAVVSINDVTQPSYYSWYGGAVSNGQYNFSQNMPSNPRENSESEMSEGQVAVDAREEVVFAIR